MNITTSYHRGSQGLPMINVKHHFWWDAICARYRGEGKPHECSDDEDFWDWADNLAEEASRGYNESHPFYAAEYWAREGGWETATEDAKEIFDDHVQVYSEGRSGGWLVVHGIGTPDEWDTEDMARWEQYEQYVKATVDGLDYDFVGLLYINFYEPMQDEIREAKEQMRSIWLPWNVGVTL